MDDIRVQNSSLVPLSETIGSVGSASKSEDDIGTSQSSGLVRAEPGQETTETDGSPRDTVELSREAQEIRQLQRRDSEVRAHEAAHAAVGGPYAGSPSFSYTKGADGKTYATGGEVSIDVSAVPDDPEATLQKANQIKAAALAPAEPSSQDMKVAQKAQMLATQARQELADRNAVETDSSNSVDGDGDGDSDVVEPETNDSSVQPSAQGRATLKDSTYDAYNGSVSDFISLSVYS